MVFGYLCSRRVVRVVDGGGLENRWVKSPGGSNPSLSESSDGLRITLFTDHSLCIASRRGARVAEGGCLLSNCAVWYRGFESPLLRIHFPKPLSSSDTVESSWIKSF